MNNLKKQLQAKSSADTNEQENQGKTQSQGDDAPAVKEKNKSKIIRDPQEQSADVKKLPYTPGVVLKFHCKGHGLTKKELRVSTIYYFDLFAVRILYFMIARVNFESCFVVLVNSFH